eukprot:Gb_17222 [translate_table: standard]
MDLILLLRATPMDALSWKLAVGGRVVSAETNCEGHSNVRNVPFDLQTRCLQPSAHQPSESQLKSCTSPSGGIFPLPSSRSLFPAPLRYLWFSKQSQEGFEEETKPDLNNAFEKKKSGSGNEFGCNDGESTRQSQVVENIGVSIRNDTEKETEISNTKNVSHGNQNNSLESFAEEDHAQISRTEAKPGSEESNLPKIISNAENVEASEEPENDLDILAKSDSKHFKCDESNQESASSWVEKIMELTFYWKDPKKYGSNSDLSAAPSDQTISSTKNTELYSSHKQVDDPDKKVAITTYCEHCNHGCGGDEFLCSVMQEVPCTEVSCDMETFSRLLHRVSLPETKIYAQMSFLSDLAYAISKIKPGDLWKMYHLQFIISSLDKKGEATSKAGDSTTNDEASFKSTSYEKKDDHNGKDGPNQKLSISPTMAYEIAASAASYFHSQTKYILPFKSVRENEADGDEKLGSESQQDAFPDENNQMSIGTKMDVEDAVAAQRPAEDQRAIDCDTQQIFMKSLPQEYSSKFSGISKSEMAAFVTASSVTALVAAEEEAKQSAADDLQSVHSSPCEWFVCDDCSSHTRIFVIQGSGSLASWQANLFFEPTQFEGFEVLVHRGIYEAAKGIYEQVMPEVLAHWKTHGEAARFRFTGHSLGGSLSVLLNLMLLIRGVVPRLSLLPAITFGSPCIMCGGDYLLQKLGLPNNHIQAIMMHRDVVPRAFACNYPDHVANILKGLNGSFRSNPCLNIQKLLYAPMGQLLILQPDEKVSPPHPLLPSGSSLYILGHPMHSESECKPSRTIQVRVAQTTFLNSPHPLETLSDPGAYGSEGSIARDHDSSNYLRAINYVLWQQTKHLRRLQREKRRQVWWPLVSGESSMHSHRGGLK